MTDKPTPKEIDDLVYELRQAGKDDTYSLASAVLAKWGQPAQKTVTVVPATGDVWLKHDDDLRYVRRVLEAGRQMTDVDQRAAIDIVQGLRVTARSMAVDAKKPAQAEEPVVREPLTDAQIAEMMRDTWGCASIAPRHALQFARAVERAHGIAQKGGSNADT